ncbi:MAG: hypothetical protein FWD35_02875 [Oscillospiraceae bacterium]|nr:hypothetical protein [Oscillospiraceae bacterium]
MEEHEKLSEIMKAFEEYEAITDKLLALDLSEADTSLAEFDFIIDDVEMLLQEREDVIESADAIRDSLTENPMKDEEFCEKFTALQERIIAKSHEFSEMFAAKFAVVKSSLKNLQSDRRKIGFLGANALSDNEGTSFNI